MQNEQSTPIEPSIHPLLSSRHSPLAFQERPIEPEKLTRAFTAAQWAPSARNEQPWRFICTNHGEDAYNRLVGLMTPTTQEWAKNAPMLILALTAKNWGDPLDVNPFAAYDLGQAVAHLTVQATADGLCLRQIGAFDPNAARGAFSVSASYDPVVLIAIGYEGSVDTLSPTLRERAEAQRIRRPLAGTVGYGKLPPAG